MWLKMLEGGWRNLDTARHLNVVESSTGRWRIMVDGCHVSDDVYDTEGDANSAVETLIAGPSETQVSTVKPERKTKR